MTAGRTRRRAIRARGSSAVAAPAEERGSRAPCPAGPPSTAERPHHGHRPTGERRRGARASAREPPTDDERRRLDASRRPLRRGAAGADDGRHAREPHAHELAGSDGLAHGDGASPAYPVLTELAHGLDLIGQAFRDGKRRCSHGPSSAGRSVRSGRVHQSGVRPLCAEGRTRGPDLLRAAVRGRLARHPHLHHHLPDRRARQRGRDDSEGNAAHLGALVGAALGFLAILFLVPSMESITSLVLVVAAGTAVAAWVVVGSPRIAYAGVQIAFAFFVCVIQGSSRAGTSTRSATV